MRFNNDQPIFQQIAGYLTDQIIAGQLAADSRLPSARELASSLEVNPNTAARALQELADAGVARCERGTGYFVAPDGREKARSKRREQFWENQMPAVFRAMEELGISIPDIGIRYETWRTNHIGH